MGDVLDEDHSGDISRNEFQVHLKQTAAEPSHGRMVPMEDFKSYVGVPAIVQGTAEIALFLSSDSKTASEEEMENKIGTLFKKSIEQQLGLIVNLASVESVQQDSGGSRDRLVMILWTSDSDSGGSVQSKLHDRAADLEKTSRIASRVHSSAGSREVQPLSGPSVPWTTMALRLQGCQMAKNCHNGLAKDLVRYRPMDHRRLYWHNRRSSGVSSSRSDNVLA